MRMVSLLFRDPLQRSFICVVQRSREFVQGLPNA
jgi:hypothetical protein